MTLSQSYPSLPPWLGFVQLVPWVVDNFPDTQPVDFPDDDYFNRSKFFCRICQSFKPFIFACASLLIFASLAFLVGRVDL